MFSRFSQRLHFVSSGMKTLVIEALIATGNGVLRDYIDEGIPFDRQNNRFELALEAAHSLPRILHMKDRTGYHLCQWLRQHIKAHVTHVTGDLLELMSDDDGITGAMTILAKDNGIFCGVEIIERGFNILSETSVELLVKHGEMHRDEPLQPTDQRPS